MLVITTLEELAAMESEGDPDFLVDVVGRKNGTLKECVQYCDFLDSVEQAKKMLANGYTVEIGESDGGDGGWD